MNEESTILITEFVKMNYNIRNKFPIGGALTMRTDIGEIDPGSLTIKVLTSNRTSMTLPTNRSFQGKVIQPGISARAEHGLSLGIRISENEASYQILLDTGGLLQTVIENCRQFKIDLNSVEKIILSHGHFDHSGGLTKVIPLVFFLNLNFFTFLLDLIFKICFFTEGFLRFNLLFIGFFRVIELSLLLPGNKISS